jgi:hypothetical protein
MISIIMQPYNHLTQLLKGILSGYAQKDYWMTKLNIHTKNSRIA